MLGRELDSPRDLISGANGNDSVRLAIHGRVPDGIQDASGVEPGAEHSWLSCTTRRADSCGRRTCLTPSAGPIRERGWSRDLTIFRRAHDCLSHRDPALGPRSGLDAVLITRRGKRGRRFGQAIPGAATLFCPLSGGQGVAAAEIPVDNGSAMAVWEVIAANPAVLESAVFGVAVAYAPNTPNQLPGLGQASVSGNFAPFYAADSDAGRMSGSLPIPRFLGYAAIDHRVSYRFLRNEPPVPVCDQPGRFRYRNRDRQHFTRSVR